jgi:hypothetical protein
VSKITGPFYGRHTVLCGLRAEAEETVAVETINETDRVLCVVCAEAEERFDDLIVMKSKYVAKK